MTLRVSRPELRRWVTIYDRNSVLRGIDITRLGMNYWVHSEWTQVYKINGTISVDRGNYAIKDQVQSH